MYPNQSLFQKVKYYFFDELLNHAQKFNVQLTTQLSNETKKRLCGVTSPKVLCISRCVWCARACTNTVNGIRQQI